MTEFDPPLDPAELPVVFAHAFNERDADLFDQLFEPDAVHVRAPGHPIGGAERRAATENVLRHRIPISVSLRHVYVAGDTALIINDYVHEGTATDGTSVRYEGTATDVARRGDDGRWRYLIDNPSGTA